MKGHGKTNETENHWRVSLILDLLINKSLRLAHTFMRVVNIQYTTKVEQ